MCLETLSRIGTKGYSMPNQFDPNFSLNEISAKSEVFATISVYTPINMITHAISLAKALNRTPLHEIMQQKYP